MNILNKTTEFDRKAEAHKLQTQHSGRGATVNMPGRFEAIQPANIDDGWSGDHPGAMDEWQNPLRTQVTLERAKSIITKNESPDLSFDRSINPYRGCEHGCSYCFARPTHAFMGLSPGLDFESKLFAKTNAAALLRNELAARGYQPRTIAIGTNTDPYQPIEKHHRIMRSILEVLRETNHPVGIVTKSSLVLRDMDILSDMAKNGLAKVSLSIPSLDRKVARTMEPRAANPELRLRVIEKLSAAGIPVSVMIAPVVPAITDHETETILSRAFAAGAREAGYILLRLPMEVADIFEQWLTVHFPNKVNHVMGLVRGARGGKNYDARFGMRMTGSGPYAWMIGRRFELAAARLGYNVERLKLRTDLFQAPARKGEQLSLF